jgi:peptidoglycan/LPS O-acetylase OafA/YrhL
LRQRELDFLRGVAILLVMCRHQYLVSLTYRFGWVGLDLFFVLSGFLVSGLLFKEYQKYGDLHLGRFLIRRGFKIYPMYYIVYLLYILIEPLSLGVDKILLVSDLIFIQNYVNGWGYAYGHSWSLAVEEHFYFSLALVFFWLLRTQELSKSLQIHQKSFFTGLEIGISATMILCLVLRLVTNTLRWEDIVCNYTMSHLRMDSLLMGVLISSVYHFRRDALEHFYISNKKQLFWVFFFGLLWTPIWDVKYTFLAKTIGFSLVYLAFGVVLIAFLLEKNINQLLDRYLSKPFVGLIAQIGVYSYGIYVVHAFVNSIFETMSKKQNWSDQVVLLFFVTTICSCAAGWALYHGLEKPFLKVRDRWFPSRAGK